MSFQGLDPNRLFANLNTTGLQNKDNPLYQLLFNMIGAILQLNQEASGTPGGGGTSTINNINNIIQQILQSDGDGGGGDPPVIPGPAGAAGADGADSLVPYFIAPTETFTVPIFKQALFAMNIDNEGIIEVDGFLIEVDRDGDHCCIPGSALPVFGLDTDTGSIDDGNALFGLGLASDPTLMRNNITNILLTGVIEITNAFTGALKLSGNAANTLVLTSPSTNSTSFLFENTAGGGGSFSFFSSGGGPAAAGTFGIFSNTAGAVRWTIDSAGAVDTKNALTNSGMGAASAGTTVVVTGASNEFRPLLSSKKFKENIQPIDTTNVMTKINQLEVKSFDYKNSTKGMIGLIAEEVSIVLPEAVNFEIDKYDPDGNLIRDEFGNVVIPDNAPMAPYSLRFDVLSAFLLAAVQELDKKIQTLNTLVGVV